MSPYRSLTMRLGESPSSPLQPNERATPSTLARGGCVPTRAPKGLHGPSNAVSPSRPESPTQTEPFACSAVEPEPCCPEDVEVDPDSRRSRTPAPNSISPPPRFRYAMRLPLTAGDIAAPRECRRLGAGREGSPLAFADGEPVHCQEGSLDCCRLPSRLIDDMDEIAPPTSPARWCLRLTPLALIGLTIGVLFAMGRPGISTCGTIALWHGEINTAEDSQQIADWYSFTHIIHGFLLYWILWLCSKKVAFLRPTWNRFTVAVLLESAWEILENTPFIINRYREATIALGYHGDSVINSTCDILFMSLGFLLAMRFPVWMVIGLAFAFELTSLFVIRDNLTLNVLMLLFPVDAIHQWQMG